MFNWLASTGNTTNTPTNSHPHYVRNSTSLGRCFVRLRPTDSISQATSLTLKRWHLICLHHRKVFCSIGRLHNDKMEGYAKTSKALVGKRNSSLTFRLVHIMHYGTCNKLSSRDRGSISDSGYHHALSLRRSPRSMKQTGRGTEHMNVRLCVWKFCRIGAAAGLHQCNGTSTGTRS